MSHRRIPRARGTIIRCDGCNHESWSGQMIIDHHRAWLRESCGWGRGQLRPTKHDPGTTGQDLCPRCLAWDQAAVERRRRAEAKYRRRGAKQRREEVRAS